MNPVAFELFCYPIRWYGIIIAGGVLVAFFISYILAKKKGLDFDIITDGFLWSFPFAIIGARLYYVAFEYKRDPFFPEEAEMLKYLKEYAKKSPYYKENK